MHPDLANASMCLYVLTSVCVLRRKALTNWKMLLIVTILKLETSVCKDAAKRVKFRASGWEKSSSTQGPANGQGHHGRAPTNHEDSKIEKR